MRRTDREITELDEIIEVMERCQVCRLALFDADYPYIVPVNFAVTRAGEQVALYFHGAGSGTKHALIKQDGRASFEMDLTYGLIAGSRACSFAMEYESVVGRGQIALVPEEEKPAALAALMHHYAPEASFTFDQAAVRSVVVYKLTVAQLTGKRLRR